MKKNKIATATVEKKEVYETREVLVGEAKVFTLELNERQFIGLTALLGKCNGGIDRATHGIYDACADLMTKEGMSRDLDFRDADGESLGTIWLSKYRRLIDMKTGEEV